MKIIDGFLMVGWIVILIGLLTADWKLSKLSQILLILYVILNCLNNLAS